MYNYNLPERPIEPPDVWNEDYRGIYREFPEEYPRKKRCWGSGGKPWYEEGDYEG